MSAVQVSILIPVYNRESLLGPCIQSAIDQTVTGIEIIVVDNASTDATWQVCQQYAKQDARVKVFRNDSNIGPVRNWQRCIKEASGEYGKILFSDDLIAPQFLEKTLPVIQNKEVGLAFTAACVGEIPWQGQLFFRLQDRSGLIASHEFINTFLFGGRTVPMSPGCALFRLADLKRNLMLDIPSPSIKDFPNHGAGPDVLCYLLAAKDYASVGFVNEQLSFFRAHPGSLTVADKANYFTQCYDQAKMWFASTYLDEITRQRYFVKYWLRRSLRKRKLLSMAEVFGKFLPELPRISTTDVLDYLKWKCKLGSFS